MQIIPVLLGEVNELQSFKQSYNTFSSYIFEKSYFSIWKVNILSHIFKEIFFDDSIEMLLLKYVKKAKYLNSYVKRIFVRNIREEKFRRHNLVQRYSQE